jgi:hypothetical protein
MEIFPTKQVYTEERYMTDRDGNFLDFATRQDAVDYLTSIGLTACGCDTYTATYAACTDQPNHRIIDRVRMYGTPFPDDTASSYPTSLNRLEERCVAYGFTNFTVSGYFAPNGEIDPAVLPVGGLNAKAENALPWYIQTKEGDPNGVYGSFIMLEMAIDRFTPQPLVAGQIRRAASQAANHNDYIDTANHLDGTIPAATIENANLECTYLIRTWEEGETNFRGEQARMYYANGSLLGTPQAVEWQYPTGALAKDTFQDYVRWNLGDNVMLYTNWIQMTDKPKDYWIIDNRSPNWWAELNTPAKADEGYVDGSNTGVMENGWDEGWVYWSSALLPGASTTDFMESMSLVNQPQGAFYYALHVDLQAISIDNINRWQATMPAQLYEYLRPVLVDSFNVLPIHQNGYISNNTEFKNVVSAPDVDTTFSFLTFTTGNPARRVSHTPVVEVTNSSGAPVDVVVLETDVEDSGESEPSSGEGDGDLLVITERTSDSYVNDGVRVDLKIPAGYHGVYNVSVKAGDDNGGNTEVRFKLIINPLVAFIDAQTLPTSAAQINSGGNKTFIIDSWEWRILSKTMGTSGTGSLSSSDILIISEYMFDMAEWNDTQTITTGNIGQGYMASTVRNTTLPAHFAAMEWAHDYAIQPYVPTGSGSSDPQKAWYTYGAYNNANNRTFSTDLLNTVYPAEQTGANQYLDGLFLLSYADFGNARNALWVTDANRISREIHSTINGNYAGMFTTYSSSTVGATNRRDAHPAVYSGRGTTAVQFMRTMYNRDTAWEVNRSGGLACCTNNIHYPNAHNINHGLRPAMLLRLPTGP